jgi:hypothetical protein
MSLAIATITVVREPATTIAVITVQAGVGQLRYDADQTLSLESQTRALANMGVTLGATGITLPNGKTIFYTSTEA